MTNEIAAPARVLQLPSPFGQPWRRRLDVVRHLKRKLAELDRRPQWIQTKKR